MRNVVGGGPTIGIGNGGNVLKGIMNAGNSQNEIN
jgi:hypothetical protein